MKTIMVFLFLAGFVRFADAGCLDQITASKNIYSKIHGFYIARAHYGAEQVHFVILDKDTCMASAQGDTALAETTKNHYYLSFKESDRALYSLLLSAQAQQIELEFRIAPPFSGSNANSISYVIFPKNARAQ
ncbi:hypothetical protein [Bowmanella denitrificans]|uniref:hypothetical protein n=1 Tax=Bowmanella denitrificans TaxID=366582 RepID=UPI000C9C519D|nr:hypothetical protein [Bowmanella denitrificans]